MVYRWSYEDGSGRRAEGPQVVFDDQAAAEEWLTANWEDLLDSGIEQVTLLADEAELYGPMSLHPA